MQNHYEINVSKLDPQTGRQSHYFATHARSNTGSEQDAKDMFNDLCVRFPKAEGFELRIVFWEASGREIDVRRSSS